MPVLLTLRVRNVRPHAEREEYNQREFGRV